jgi:hypothetical protein
VFHMQAPRAGWAQEDPEGQVATPKAEGGAVKFQRAATASDRMRTHCSRERCVGPEPRRAGQHHGCWRRGPRHDEQLSHLEPL